MAWTVAAIGAIALLGGVLVWEYHELQARSKIFLGTNPQIGADLFFGRKHCAHCHAINGVGGRTAPDLGSPRADVGQLVTSLWNQAPSMWQRMQAEKVSPPILGYQGVGDLLAFVYTARYVDEPGDASRGKALFQSKGCIQCHAVKRWGGNIGRDLSQVSGVDTPLWWSQAMWNHVPEMEGWARKLSLAWPKLGGREMNDLLAFIREAHPGGGREKRVQPGNPEHGRKLLQTKFCIVCHSVGSQGGNVGPPLDQARLIPPTLVQFASSMWNHASEMLGVMKARGIPLPTLKDQELADLVVFFQGLGFIEPRGSAQIGESLFAAKGCSHCHGLHAEGTRRGPALRKRDTPLSPIAFATVLWRHGPKMYQEAKKDGLAWPLLTEDDLGPLLSYLNSPRVGK